MTSSRFLLATIFLALLPGCGTPKQQKREPHGTVSVKVVAPAAKNSPIWLAAYATTDGQRGKELQSYKVQDGSVTGFVLPVGQTYEIHGFIDLDGDGKPGPGEPSASLTGVKPDPDLSSVQAPLVLNISDAGGSATRPEKKSSPAVPAKTAPAGESLPQKDDGKPKDAGAVPPVPPPPTKAAKP